MRVQILALAFVSFGVAAHHTASEGQRLSRQHNPIEDQLQVAQTTAAPLTKEMAILEDDPIDTSLHVNILNNAPVDFNLALKVCNEGHFDIEPKLFVQRFNLSRFSITGPVLNSVRCLVHYVAQDINTYFRLEKDEGGRNILARCSGSLRIQAVPIDDPTVPNMVTVYIRGWGSDPNLLPRTAAHAHPISDEQQQKVTRSFGAPLANKNAILADSPDYTNTHVFMWNHIPKDFKLTMKMCSVDSFDVEPPLNIANGMVSAHFSMTGPAFNSTVHLVLCTVEYATEDKKTWFYVEKRDGDQDVSVTSSSDLHVIVSYVSRLQC